MQTAKNAFENTKAAAGKAVEKMHGSDQHDTSDTRSGQHAYRSSGPSQNLRSGTASRQHHDAATGDYDNTGRHREHKDPNYRGGSGVIAENIAKSTHVDSAPVKTRDTEVQELINPAVTHEKIKPAETIETSTHIDRDVHQDHYQTRVQPIKDKTVLPTRSESRDLPTEYREESHHRNKDIEARLAKEHSQFQSTTTVQPTSKTVHQGDVSAEEHRHHHVHEIIQPVVEREVIQPTLVHTNANIHEKIQKEPTIHPKTVQPAMTMEEFQRAGGKLDTSSTTVKGTSETFSGEPQVIENGGADVKYPNKYASSTDQHPTTSRKSSSSSH